MAERAIENKGLQRLLPGVVYEMTPAGPTPLGPSLGENVSSNPSPGGETRGPGLARLGLKQGAEPVPGYHLVALIGAGSMGEVWQASGPGGFPLAMKFLALGERDTADRLHSLSLIKEIRHAHLITIFGVWHLDGLLIVGMDLAEGSLADHGDASDEEGIPFEELIGYLEQAARGLDFLNHPPIDRLSQAGAGLVHRDVKPSNLFLVGGLIKVGDFGLVASLDEPPRTQGVDGPEADFLPPECSDGRLDVRSDQYSLAMTYYRLRTGGPAIVEDGENPTTPGEPDLTLLPARERPALSRALAKDPQDRWPNCMTFVQELARAGEREGATEEPPAVIQAQTRWPLSRIAITAAASIILLAMPLPFLSQRIKAPRVNHRFPTAEVVLPEPEPVEESRIDPAPLESRPRPVAIVVPPPPEPSVEAPSEPRREEPTEPVVVAVSEPAEGSSSGRLREDIALAAQAGGAAWRRFEWPDWQAALAARSRLIDLALPRPTLEIAMTLADSVERLPATPTPLTSPKPPEPAPEPKSDRATTPAAESKTVEVARPRPSTINVLLPGANAELVVRGEVGRGNPDEWYGPKRVVHTPPIGEEMDYLVGSFWTDRDGVPRTRTKALKVKPGKTYEVDLRVAEPTLKEVRP